MDKYLIVHLHTSGLWPQSVCCDDATHEHKYPQITEYLAAVITASDLKVVDCVHSKVMWNTESLWDAAAAKHTGRTDRLDGIPEDDAAYELAELILKHFGPVHTIPLAGYNSSTFIRPFLVDLFNRHEYDIRFSTSALDLAGLALCTPSLSSRSDVLSHFGISTSDVSLPDKLKNTIKLIKIMRTLA